MSRLLSFWILFVTFFSQAVPCYAQVPVATDCYFISNAKIIVRPGDTINQGNIILRDGVIEAVGANVKAPYDAKVIKADSLFVYAGFVDAYSHTGIKEEDKKDKKVDKPSSPGMATLNQAGFTPQLMSVDFLSVKEKSISSMRKQGFVLSHAMPKGLSIPGQGALISLKETNSTDALVVKNNTSMAMQLKTKRGVFPSTIIGAMSKLREVFRNTELYKSNITKYDMNPRGWKRPEYKAEYAAMIPVIERKMPVFFTASKPKDIHRAMTLQKELGFDIILNDVKLMTPIKNIVPPNTPILLSLDLPKEIKDEKDEKKDEEGKETNEEKERLLKAKKESYDMYMAQAKWLSESGRPFAFAYNSVKSSDIHKNIKRLIKAGLSQKAALEALTITPSKMLAIEDIAGTVEKGKLASIVIFDKPVFDEKSAIRYVFVEGQMEEFEAKKKKEKSKKKSDGELSNIEGTWRYEVDVMGETEAGNMYIEKDGSSYKIGVESDDEPGEVDYAEDIQVDGNTMSMTLNISNEGMVITYTLDLTFEDENRFEGSVTVVEAGSFPIQGDKRDRPDRHQH